jgi:hypothetical protein
MDFTERYENVFDHLLAIRPGLDRLPSNDFKIKSNAAKLIIVEPLVSPDMSPA